MGVMAYRRTSTALQRCDLCKHTARTLYHMQLGEYQYKFCSGAHAESARKNYETKEKLHITPLNPDPLPEDLESLEAEGANIPE